MDAHERLIESAQGVRIELGAPGCGGGAVRMGVAAQRSHGTHATAASAE